MAKWGWWEGEAPQTQEDWGLFYRLKLQYDLDQQRAAGAPTCLWCGCLKDEHVEMGQFPNKRAICPTSFWQEDFTSKKA